MVQLFKTATDNAKKRTLLATENQCTVEMNVSCDDEVCPVCLLPDHLNEFILDCPSKIRKESRCTHKVCFSCLLSMSEARLDMCPICRDDWGWYMRNLRRQLRAMEMKLLRGEQLPMDGNGWKRTPQSAPLPC